MSSEPTSAADTAREALRRLAHATSTMPEPGDSYAVLGSLHAGIASLRQVFDQLADWHEHHAPSAATDPRQAGSQVAADIAAAELREAAAFLERAFGRLSAAWSHNGRIVWHPDPQSADAPHRPAATSPFRGAVASSRDDGLTL